MSAAQATTYLDLVPVYAAEFRDPNGQSGLRLKSITNPTEIRQIASYFAWTAWSASANQVGKDYSYTNNWPPEPLVGNGPSADVVLWSALSLITLLAGTGALFAPFGRWNWLGWRGREKTELRFREPQTVALTKSQRATAFFWLTMTALFLVQTIVGAASAHYRADPKSFFGIDRAQTGDHGQDEERVAWPHSEVPRLFAGLAAVASTAAVVLMRGRDRPQPQQP